MFGNVLIVIVVFYPFFLTLHLTLFQLLNIMENFKESGLKENERLKVITYKKSSNIYFF